MKKNVLETVETDQQILNCYQKTEFHYIRDFNKSQKVKIQKPSRKRSQSR